MKIKILLLSFVLGIMVAFCLVGIASATTEYTTQVIPLVNVDPGGGLSIVSGTTGENNNLIDFGHLGPGTTQGKTLTLGVTANGAWSLTVSKSRDLKDDSTGKTILSSNFNFTSNGPDGPTYTTSDTEFGTTASPANVATNGPATSSCNVNVIYKLVIPADQAAGYYTAPYHTYTLIVQ